MKKLRILTLAFCLLVPTAAFAQTAAANRSWSGFWTRFSTAINKKDRVALKKLTASPQVFSLNGGGLETPDQWIAIIQKEHLWSEYQTSVAAGTKPYRCPNRTCRITTNNHLLFEFIGGRWQWTGLLGD